MSYFAIVHTPSGRFLHISRYDSAGQPRLDANAKSCWWSYSRKDAEREAENWPDCRVIILTPSNEGEP